MSTSPSVAVLGARGFIGSHLAELGGATLTREEVDLAVAPDIASLRLADRGHTHLAICAAVSEIGTCETDPTRTRAVNVEGTLAVAERALSAGLAPIAFSSDYVFDGVSGAYDDDAAPAPVVEYGRQKAELERRAPAGTLILRLSKVFGTKRGDGTLLDEMAASLAAGATVRAAVDQVFCPIQVDDVVMAIRALAAIGATGTFNLCGPERVSRLELAQALASMLGTDPDLVEEISLDDLCESFTRPKHTDMVPTRLTQTIPFEPTPLEGSLARVAEAWRAR